MTRIARNILAALFVLLAAVPVAFAQSQRSYSQAELDQMLAPIALYPDALLSQVLMAATFPEEVTEAARWTRAHQGLSGDEAIRAAQNEEWDPSVKSLVAFPEILQRMDENADWTGSLGGAFLAQELQVMDTVQQLRRRAQAAGSLQSGEQLRVEQQDQAILLEPASPQSYYVPYYDPVVAYGSWWWPAYPPMAWAPWPGYARPFRPGLSASLWWGRPVGLSRSYVYGGFDWRARRVRLANVSGVYARRQEARTRIDANHHWEGARQRFVDARAAPRVVDRQPVAVQAQVQEAQRQVQPQFRPQPQFQPRAVAEVRAQPQFHRPPEARPQPQVRHEPQFRPQPQVQPRAVAEVLVQPRFHRPPEARPQPQVRHEQSVRVPQAPQARVAQPPRAEHRPPPGETRQHHDRGRERS